MSYDSPTGVPVSPKNSKNPFTSGIDVTGGSAQLSEDAGENLTGGVFPRSQRTISNALPSAGIQRTVMQSVTSPARRDAIRRALLSARNEAERMESFAIAGECVDLSLAGFQLLSNLEELWSLRAERESDFADLLNILQGALSQEEFEKLSPYQCTSIRTIVVDYLGSGMVDYDEIERSIRLLRKAGFDPWKGISGSLETNDVDE